MAKYEIFIKQKKDHDGVVEVEAKTMDEAEKRVREMSYTELVGLGAFEFGNTHITERHRVTDGRKIEG